MSNQVLQNTTPVIDKRVNRDRMSTLPNQDQVGSKSQAAIGEYSEFHIFIRVISRNPLGGNGADLSTQIEDELKTKWLDNGWKIYSIHYVGSGTEGHEFVWFLVR